MLFFNVAHYVLRPWPWILVALASLIVYPTLGDIQHAFPHLDPRLLGHDVAYPAMLTFLPAGFLGLMVGGLIAASSSTLLTHLNWGASYLVHDFYRRFIRPDATERHYVRAGRLATVGLFICGAGTVYLLDSAKNVFDLILQIGAGTGLLYLVRWFWWRVTAWCEIAAMASSFVVSVALLILGHRGHPVPTDIALVVTVAITTLCWVVTAFAGPETDPATLLTFYERVRPPGPGWTSQRAAARPRAADAPPSDSVPRAILGWVSGSTAIWAALFAEGSYLYGRTAEAVVLSLVFVVAGTLLVRVLTARRA